MCTSFSTSTFLNYATDTTGFYRLFPGIRSKPCTLNFHFVIPFFREILLNWGLGSCASASVKHMLTASNNPNHPANRDGFTSNAVVLVVGGAAESLHCRPNNFQLVLKKRKGFCKIALETGASIVPVLHFGELDLFDQPPNPPGSPLRNFQEWIKNTTGIAPAAFRGVGFLQNTYGIIPRPKPLNAVIGRPIEMGKIEKPTQADVDKLHERFCKELTELFEENKPKYVENYKNVKLVLDTGCFLSFATDWTGFCHQYPGIRSRVVTLDIHLIVPFFRELCFSWGVASSSEKCIVKLLQAPNDPDHKLNSDGNTSNAVVIIVGGAAESLNCRPNNYQLVLKRRKGFCRIALQTGTALVPVINFGELDLFDQPSNPPGSRLRTCQEWMKAKTGIAPPAFIGRGFFQYNYGLIPRRKPINTVIGAPIEVARVETPSAEQIEALHAKFCTALEDLFETHKSSYVENHENVKLIVD
ncbi:hypothetical protein quinque_004189 [Culex quinquefasciatus]